LLIPTTADAYPDWTLDYFKTVIDRATEGNAIVLQFHGVPDVAHPWVHTDPVLFGRFMDYLEESDVKVIAMKDLDRYLDVQEVDDPALNDTAGAPGLYNPCPEEGDVWILAGQSNMQGAGRTPDTLVTPHIWMMNLDDHWSLAQAPLHRIYESRAPAHVLAWHELFGDREKGLGHTRDLFEQNARESRLNPLGGVGPGIYFARYLQEHTGDPVGLIPSALGGSKIDQWNPAGLEQGDSTLYGAMIGRIRKTGREHIRGLLWYQGESEAMLGETDTYEEKFLRFVDAVREDVGRPDLPVLLVQIGRMNLQDTGQGQNWEAIREAQRKLVTKRKHLYFTTAIDLEYDDVVHLSTESNRILGQRLAQLALSHVYEYPGFGRQVEPESVELLSDPDTGSPCLKINYRGVSGTLTARGNPASFQLRFGNHTRVHEVVSRVWLDAAHPSSVFLNLSRIPEETAQLYCGPGIHPTMNISDSLDMPIPAFGPVDINFKQIKNQKIFL
jgi:sialate O-acetylesterase